MARILVIDDEELVRLTLRQTLENQGHDVSEAVNGSAALKLQRSEPADLVITDLLMDDYDQDSPEWEKAKKIFNILGDKVETVTPYLVDGILKSNKDGASVAWLTGPKAFARFMTAGFKKRDLFAD